MPDQILCPNCGKSIQITEALSKQIQEEAEKKYEIEIQKLQKQNQEKIKEFENLQKKQQEEFTKKIAAKELELKKELWEKAQQKAEEKFSIELKDLKEKNSEDDKRKKELEDEILNARKQMREIEEETRKAKIELQKELDEEKEKIRKKTEEELLEEHRLKDLEKDKKLEDMKKQIEDLKRKAEQGSQQNQGEVLELDLEQNLKKFFIHDIIEPIAKGISGADILHTICNRNGSPCGSILYEIKQTKNWTEGWVSKFKDDYRKVKADIPVLITTSLPKDVNGFSYYQGIWVTSPSYAISLTTALRKGIIAAAYERSVSKGKGQKSEMLFEYISSNEFRQHVESLVEVFTEMNGQLSKEKLVFEKQWKVREKQIERLMISTASMYGDMQGLVGSAMPEVKGLEMNETQQLKDGEQKLF